MRTTIGIESLRRYLKCTSIALQHAYQHTVCSRADVGRRRVNPNADRVSRVAHAPLRFGRLGTIAAAPPTRHAAPNSMPFDDLAARREPDRFSATMRAALQTTPCEPSRRNPLPTCTWPGQNRRRPLAAIQRQSARAGTVPNRTRHAPTPPCPPSWVDTPSHKWRSGQCMNEWLQLLTTVRTDSASAVNWVALPQYACFQYFEGLLET